MSPPHSLPKAFTAETGAISYDHISWSAPPISRLIATADNGVRVLRHLGSATTDTLQTRSKGNLRHDSLLLARRCIGAFEAHGGGAFKSSDLTRDLCCYLPQGVDADLEFPASSQALILHFPSGFLSARLPMQQSPIWSQHSAFAIPGSQPSWK